ncbi:bifunctional folylpolyglutamate synthase/dihydrofolate synthase [Kaistella rhinocerotis]|uniref:bifunctional folylpolyglutamate synthase/dihydrofolate synthase n=1 Tax=Kaistella rhinocerotis TaxID=3026437 RepID=UPI002552DCDE|nr:folylpolyglutamate synthase/dihydrofolate synthase family protein [Kaistella sp. Ran72]
MTNQEYDNAVAWLFEQAPNYQIDGKKAYKPGLENITKLCEFFGNPQQNLKMVHIGGTNGKGSTSNMLSSILQEAGYKTGLYNSPHLIDFTERIKIDGQNCDREFVFDFIQKLKKLPADIQPSFFEFTTVMAFEYFRLRNVDIALIEVGLGGRLDSTNIITPLVSAITNVALDHQDILGETLEEIAREKAGIIKPGIPVISGSNDEEVKRIIEEKAKENASDFIDATLMESDLKSDLNGSYQRHNIKVVLALINELQTSGYEISAEQIERGLLNVQKNTNFAGRWMEFSSDPFIICDTAHNQAGLEVVFSQLESIPVHKHIILGFVQEKKIDQIMAILPRDATYYFTKPNVNRGRDPRDYEDLLKRFKINYKIFDSLQPAYLSAKQNIKKDEMIFVGGSNFIVGEFLEKNLEK